MIFIFFLCFVFVFHKNEAKISKFCANFFRFDAEKQKKTMSGCVDAQTVAESPEIQALRSEIHDFVEKKILKIIDTVTFLENEDKDEFVLNGTPPKFSVFDKRRQKTAPESPEAAGDLTTSKNELLVKQFVNRESLLT